MQKFIYLIREYRTSKNKKAYFSVLLEKSREIQFPTYALIQLLNSINNESSKSSSNEGWLNINRTDLKEEEKLIKKERVSLEIARKNLENDKKEEVLLKKIYIALAVVAVLLIVVFYIIPTYKTAEDNKLWENTIYKNTIAAYDIYLKSFPEGIHYDEAIKEKQMIRESVEEERWNEVMKTDTKIGYQQYLVRIKKVTKYEEEARERIDVIDWGIALEKNSVRGYKSYMVHHNSVDGKYYSNAMDAMKVLQKKYRILDEKEWEKAVSNNSIEDYENYLKNNPKGEFITQANEKILLIKNSKIDSNQEDAIENYREADYSEVIRNYISAEDNRNFDKIYSFYSTNLKRYWSTKNPSYSKLKKQYENSWKSTSYSKNYIDRIVRNSVTSYDLFTKYEFFRIKLDKTFTVESQIRIVFDGNGKIIEVYKLN